MRVRAQMSAGGVNVSRNALPSLHLSQKLCTVVSATVLVGVPVEVVETRGERPLQLLRGSEL